MNFRILLNKNVTCSRNKFLIFFVCLHFAPKMSKNHQKSHVVTLCDFKNFHNFLDGEEMPHVEKVVDCCISSTIYELFPLRKSMLSYYSINAIYNYVRNFKGIESRFALT